MKILNQFMQNIHFTKKHLAFLGYIVILLYISFSYFVNLLSISRLSEIVSDFGSFYASALFAIDKMNPYSINSPLINYVNFPEIGVNGIAPNLNPPISILLFELFTKFDLQISIIAWRIFMVILYAVSLYLLERLYPSKGAPFIFRILWAFSLSGFWHMIKIGQIYGVIIFLVVLTWIMLKKERYLLAGIFLGLLIALKPNFILWSFILLADRKWRVFITSGVIAGVVSAIPIFRYGHEVYYQWIEATTMYTPDLLVFPGNNSFLGLLSRLQHGEIAVIINICFCVLIFSLIFLAKPNVEQVSSLGIVMSLLVSPIAWTGYTIVTLPIFYKIQRWKFIQVITAAIFSFPFSFIPLLFIKSDFNFIFWGWFYGWGLLLIMIWEVASNIDKNKELGKQTGALSQEIT